MVSFQPKPALAASVLLFFSFCRGHAAHVRSHRLLWRLGGQERNRGPHYSARKVKVKRVCTELSSIHRRRHPSIYKQKTNIPILLPVSNCHFPLCTISAKRCKQSPQSESYLASSGPSPGSCFVFSEKHVPRISRVCVCVWL